MSSLKNYQNDYTTMSQYSRGSNQLTFRSNPMRPSTAQYPPQQSSYLPHFYNNQQQYYYTQAPPRKSISSNKQSRYHSNGQLSKSSISMISLPLGQQQIDGSQKLRELEQKIMQQILILREEKLTLMEESNMIVQNRFKVQREINKIHKRIQTQENKQQITSNTAHNHEISMKYQQLKQQQNKTYLSTNNQIEKNQQRQLTQEQLKILQKIMNIRDTNKFIQTQLLNQPLKSNFSQSQQYSSPSVFSPSLDISTLRIKKQKLLQLLISHTKKKQLQQFMKTIMQSNKQLQVVLDNYLKNKQQTNKLKKLRQIKQKQEKQKINFLQQLIQIKTQIKCLKIQNQEMRKALSFFRL